MAFYLTPIILPPRAIAESTGFQIHPDEAFSFDHTVEDRVLLALEKLGYNESLAVIPSRQALQDYMWRERGVIFYSVSLEQLFTYDIGWTREEVLDLLTR